MTATLTAPDSETIARAKAMFEEHYPRIHNLAQYQHCKLHGEMKADAVAETEGWVWKAFSKKVMAGEDPLEHLASTVRFAAQHVKSGKLIGRNAPSESPAMSLSTEEGERDVAHRVPGPAAEAIAELDYRDWLGGLSEAQREVAEGLVAGDNLTEIAEKKGVSKTAVQQTAARVRQSLDAFRGR